MEDWKMRSLQKDENINFRIIINYITSTDNPANYINKCRI